MRIDFFETNNGMDTRAVGAGVYMIELENRITKNKVCLYIGGSHQDAACIYTLSVRIQVTLDWKKMI